MLPLAVPTVCGEAPPRHCLEAVYFSQTLVDIARGEWAPQFFDGFASTLDNEEWARSEPIVAFTCSNMSNSWKDAMMDHSNHVRLSQEELTPQVLEGATIYGPGDEKIGTVSHLHGSEVVIDVGGFLGIGAKPVAVSATELDFMRDESGDVHAVTTWTKDQLKEMPEHHH